MPLADDQIKKLLGEAAMLGPEPKPELTALPRLQELRRGRRRPASRPASEVRLVEYKGLSLWEWGPAKPRTTAVSGRKWRAGSTGSGTPDREIFSQLLQPLGVNQIGEMLLAFDGDRNKQFDRKAGWTLRQWYDGPGQLGGAAPALAHKVLVIVHGTASCADHIFDEILLAPGGRKMLADAALHYSAVLAFEHPTLSMSPVLNALDLSAALSPYGDCDVDIVCHSRGGLVASWWMHVVDSQARQKRCVFVGSPLQGTNLANPAKLRSSLHLMATYARVLGNVGVAAGFLALPMTIIKVAASVVDFTAKTPLLDAALAMIPGLSAQSAIENNQELLRLNARKVNGGAPQHYYIRTNFEPSAEGWKFWRYFRDGKERLIDAAVDTFVFPGENDLVVDTESMLDVVQGEEYRFPSSDGLVHHTNYFEQAKTIDLIRSWLKIQ